MTVPRIHLASSSPRRRELLIAMGLDFTHGGTDVDEYRKEAEGPDEMVRRLAVSKARAADIDGSRVVIGADTAVVLGDEVFGKPGTCDEAQYMLASLSGRTHEVMTGVAVLSGQKLFCDLSVTEVRFREIGPEEASAYWQSGEPRGKAGAYAIQGRGGVFAESISGSYTGVVGLPVFETGILLGRAGIDVLTNRDAG